MLSTFSLFGAGLSRPALCVFWGTLLSANTGEAMNRWRWCGHDLVLDGADPKGDAALWWRFHLPKRNWRDPNALLWLDCNCSLAVLDWCCGMVSNCMLDGLSLPPLKSGTMWSTW